MKSKLIVLLFLLANFIYAQYWIIELNDGLKLDSCKSLILENDILHGAGSSINYFSIHIGDIKELQYRGNWRSSFSMGGCVIGLGLGAFGLIPQLNRNTLSDKKNEALALAWIGLMIGGSTLFAKSPNKNYNLSELDLAEKRELIQSLITKSKN